MSLWAGRSLLRGKAYTDYSPCVSWDTIQDFWNYCLNPRDLPLERRFFQHVSPYLQGKLGLPLAIHKHRMYGNMCLFNLMPSSAWCNEYHERDGFVYIETWNWPWRADFTWAKPHELPFLSILSRKQSCLLFSISMENRNRVGVCVEEKGVKKSGKESDGLLKVDFICFRCVLAMISMSPVRYSCTRTAHTKIHWCF